MAVILNGSYYSAAALWNDALSSGKSRFLGCSILRLSCDSCLVRRCCFFVAGSPHIPIKTQQDVRDGAALAGWIIHLPSSSSSLAMERLWLVSTQILLIILCVPPRQRCRDALSQKQNLLFLSERQYVLHCSRSVTVSVAAGHGHRASSSPPSSCLFPFAPLGLPAAVCDARWQKRSLHAISAFSWKAAVCL